MKVKELVSKINLPARATMGYLGASLVGKAIGILTTPFFTRLISEEEYGALTLYMTVLGGASVICSAVSSGSAVYRGFKTFESKNGGFTKSVLAVSFVFSLVICLLLFALIPFLGLNQAFYIPLVLQILCDSIIGVSMSRARFRYKYGEVMAVGIISSAIPALISLAILTWLGKGFGVRIYSLLAISLIVAAIQLARILSLPGRADKEMRKYMIRSSVPLLPHSISVALSGQADKLFITTFMGAAALAKYSVVHSLGIALQFVITALGSALGPWMIRRLDTGEDYRIRRVISTLFSLFCTLSLGLCALAPEAMQILAPGEYLEALPALIPIALSTPLSFLSYTITVSLVHAEKGKYTALISAVNLALCVLLNYTLIPSLGYFGAGLALLLSQLGGAVIGIWLISRAEICQVFNAKNGIARFMVSCLIGGLTMLFFNSLSLRIILLLIPAIWGLNGLFECKRLVIEAK